MLKRDRLVFGGLLYFCALMLGIMMVSIYENLQAALSIFIFMLCLIPILQQHIYKGKINFFSIQTYTTFYLALIFFGGYYFYQIRKTSGLGFLSVGEFDDVTLLKSMLYAAVGIFMWIVGFKAGQKIKLSRSVISSKPFDFTLKIPIAFLLGFYITAVAFYCYSVGGLPLFIEGYHGEARTELGKGLGYVFAVIFAIASFLLVAFSKELLSSPQKRSKIKQFLIIFIPLTCLICLNERGAAIGYLLSLLIIHNQTRRLLKIRTLATIFIMMVVFAGIMGIIRNGRSANETGTAFLVNVALEAGVEFDNYTEVIRAVPDELSNLFGATILPIFTLPIPRAILPEKDNIFKPAAVVFKEHMHHEHIRVGERISLPGELYLNFGIAGILIGMFFYGIIGGKIDRIFAIQSKSVYFQGIYPIVLINYSGLVVGDIATTIIGFITAIIFVGLIPVFSKKVSVLN